MHGRVIGRPDSVPHISDIRLCISHEENHENACNSKFRSVDDRRTVLFTSHGAVRLPILLRKTASVQRPQVLSSNQCLSERWFELGMSMRGQRIGNGECTELAKMHLMYSRALPGNFSDYRNYIWGGMSTNGYRPGDILQFEYCKFSWKTSTSWGEITMDHHTAIVVSANGSKLQILQQNAPFGVQYDLTH